MIYYNCPRCHQPFGIDESDPHPVCPFCGEKLHKPEKSVAPKPKAVSHPKPQVVKEPPKPTKPKAVEPKPKKKGAK